MAGRPAPAPRLALAILAAWVVPAAAVTLYPMERAVGSAGFDAHGIAETLANVVLFVPFGAALWLRGWRLPACVLAGFLVSGCVEAAQIGIDGRDPTAKDLVTNAFGAWVGGLVAAFLHLTRNPRDTRIHVALAALLPVCAVLFTGLMLKPKLTTIPWTGQWTLMAGHPSKYEGKVEAANVGAENLRSLPLKRYEAIRELLLKGARVQVKAVAGPPPPSIAPIVTIVDENREENLLLGADGEDLVLRWRTMAARFRMHHPTLRARGAFAGVKPGDPLFLEAWWQADGTACASVNGAETCGLGSGPGAGWTLLHYPQKLALKVGPLLDLAWMALLFFPLAYWTRWTRASGVAWLVALGGIAGAVVATPLLGPGLFEVLGVVVGSASGIYIARTVRHAARQAPA